MNEEHMTFLSQTTMERKEYDVPLQDTIQSRFEAFDKANPRIYEYVKRFALEAKHSGRPHFGIAAIIERARWELAISVVKTSFDDDWKINNDYRSRYARRLMSEVPELAGFFRVRDLRTA